MVKKSPDLIAQARALSPYNNIIRFVKNQPDWWLLL